RWVYGANGIRGRSTGPGGECTVIRKNRSRRRPRSRFGAWRAGLAGVIDYGDPRGGSGYRLTRSSSGRERGRERLRQVGKPLLTEVVPTLRRHGIHLGCAFLKLNWAITS